MSALAVAIVSLASGLLGSLGMGAGTVLLVYLRIWGGCDQLAAQGINLLFFLPVAALSLVLHTRHKLVDWKAAGLCVIAGLPTVFAGVWLCERISSPLLSKLFAGLLVVVGVRELFYRQSEKRKS